MIDVGAIRERVDLVEVVGRYVKLRRAGKEFEGLCPFHEERTPSFTVDPIKGFTHCFGCGAHDDVIGFVMRAAGCSFLDACAQLGVGVEALAPIRSQHKTLARVIPTGAVWVPICPVPLDAPAVEVGKTLKVWNPKRDKWWFMRPSRADAYRDAAGRVLGYVMRVEFDDKKVTPQVTWCVGPDGEQRWCVWPFPPPRPLCGLDALAAKPSGPVLVVEGEKCRAAGAGAWPKLAVICWPGGAKGLKHVDWAPLAGRDLVLWPDADPQGWSAMCGEKAYDGRVVDGVVQYAMLAGAQSIRVIDTRGFRHGWDIADALQVDGWTAAQLSAWGKARIADIDVQRAA